MNTPYKWLLPKSRQAKQTTPTVAYETRDQEHSHHVLDTRSNGDIMPEYRHNKSPITALGMRCYYSTNTAATYIPGRKRKMTLSYKMRHRRIDQCLPKYGTVS